MVFPVGQILSVWRDKMCIRDRVTKMHEAEFPLEQIAAIAEISVERVKEIID